MQQQEAKRHWKLAWAEPVFATPQEKFSNALTPRLLASWQLCLNPPTKIGVRSELGESNALHSGWIDMWTASGRQSDQDKE